VGRLPKVARPRNLGLNDSIQLGLVAVRPNQGWNHSVWETVFGATPKTATGTAALPSKDPVGGRAPWWPSAKTRPKAVWGGRTGQRAFEYVNNMEKKEPQPANLPDFDLNYFKTLFNESDRGFVILAMSRIDEVLEELHKTHIKSISSPSNKFLDDLFGGHGTLSTLSARIKLAFGYGLVSKEDYLDLELLRGLRNGAAHTVEEFGFRQPAIRDKIISFTAPKRVPQQIPIVNLSTEQRELLAHPKEDANSTKLHFLIAGMCLNFVLMEKILKITRQNVDACQPTAIN
jgi:DNA-binding MltR family transcriptional regulator